MACLLPANAQPTGPVVCTNHIPPPARGPLLRADLDGDRRADRVWVAGRMTQDGKCHFTAVATGQGWTAKRSVVPRDNSWVPRLVVLAVIDGTRGAEIVIERDRSSNYSSALVLTVRNRHLVTLAAPRNPMNAGGVFTYANADAPGGTIQVDCPKPGTVVTSGFRWLSSGSDPYGDPHYYAERRTYHVTGTRFRQVAATVIPNADRGQAADILVPSFSPGEVTSPFISCAVTHFT